MKRNTDRKKTIRFRQLAVVFLFGLLTTGCDKKETEEKEREQVVLEVMVQTYGDADRVFREICESFTQETGILISYSAPSEGYEEILKTRMAVNDMPDVWDTHGWAVRRYKEYIRPLEDQSYTEQIDPLIRPFLEDKEGRLCAFPVGITVNGIVYNKTVLQEAGIDPREIETWDDLTAAAETIAKMGIRPFALGGSDKWSIGCCFLGLAGAYFDMEKITDACDHTTWESWDEICQIMRSWKDKNLILEDSLQNTNLENGKALGRGEAAFGFSTGLVAYGLQEKEDAEFGIMPYPAKKKGESRSIQIGEQIAFAVNKDTLYEEEALLFLKFLSRQESLKKIADARKLPSGIADIGPEKEQVKGITNLLKSEEILKLPVFDRRYLPSGMWDTLYQEGQEIFYGSEDAALEAAERLKKECQGDME